MIIFQITTAVIVILLLVSIGGNLSKACGTLTRIDHGLFMLYVVIHKMKGPADNQQNAEISEPEKQSA